MGINIHVLAYETYNYSLGRFSPWVMGKRYHGFHCDDGWIIESCAAPDKQTCAEKEETLLNLAPPPDLQRTSNAQ
jgi:hypothetical protein